MSLYLSVFCIHICIFTTLNIVIKGNVTDKSINTHTSCAYLNVHRFKIKWRKYYLDGIVVISVPKKNE